jgi:hypothetical protein
MLNSKGISIRIRAGRQKKTAYPSGWPVAHSAKSKQAPKARRLGQVDRLALLIVGQEAGIHHIDSFDPNKHASPRARKRLKRA